MSTETQVSDVAERLRSHVEMLANISMTIALDQWSAISNGILNSADLIERQQKEIDELRESAEAYLAELDSPVPDYLLRRKYLADLRRALLDGGVK